jgi:hypothetical protein
MINFMIPWRAIQRQKCVTIVQARASNKYFEMCFLFIRRLIWF